MRKALVVYLVAEPETPELARVAVEAGADIVELGFPFSDPLADGPVIQRASERALARGMRTRTCLDCLAATRELVGDTPIVPMTYAAILEAYGWERFAADASANGATSLIVSDVPAGRRPEVRGPRERSIGGCERVGEEIRERRGAVRREGAAEAERDHRGRVAGRGGDLPRGAPDATGIVPELDGAREHREPLRCARGGELSVRLVEAGDQRGGIGDFAHR